MMIRQLLASGELGKLASFVSPAFFDVMPAKALWREARSLLGKSRNAEAFRHAVADRDAKLSGRQPIELAQGPPGRAGAPPGQSALPPSERAQQVVELYFRQLFDDGVTLLDLRASAFTPQSAGLRWHPARWLKDWSPEFVEPLRAIYRGFYCGDDAQFLQGVRALSLAHSQDLFRTHFGGDQTHVRFRTKDFVDTFHQVFVRCKEHKTTLHPDFLSLGIYLAALYEHVEQLDVTVDVASAFERALQTANPTQHRSPPSDGASPRTPPH